MLVDKLVAYQRSKRSESIFLKTLFFVWSEIRARFLTSKYFYFLFFAATLFSILKILDVVYPLNLPNNNEMFARVVVDDQGRPLRAFADEKGIWRYPVALESVSPLYLEALLTFEDKWFWHHPGINPIAIGRAAVQNIYHGRIVSGGSTISMQVARLLHPHSRSLKGKMYQALRTLQLEWHLSKKDILTLYCNIAPFGGTIEGVEAASYTYLNKPSSALSHAEAALLAVLPQSPTRFRPDLHPSVAQKARDKVLDRMVDLKVWNRDQVEDAKIEAVYGFQAVREQHAPLLARRLLNEHIRQNKNKKEIDRKFDLSEFGPLKTTIDGDLQRSLEEYIKNYISRFPDEMSAAILVVENKSLDVKTYIGTADFGNNQRFGHVDMVQALRSPGSALKPFLYALAMDDGLIHSQSLLADVPRTWGAYRPENFTGAFSGPVSVTDALQRSLNLPAVDVLERFGESKFVALMNNAGIPLRIPGDKANLSIILGGGGTSLEALVKGYAAFANGGLTKPLNFTRETDTTDAVNIDEERYFFSPESAWVVQDILAGVDRPGRLRTLALTSNKQNLAWKTGTSYGHRDAWAIGLNAEYTIGVWVGRPDGTPVPENNGRYGAGPLLHAVSDHLTIHNRSANVVKFKKPANIVKRKICWPEGTLLTSKNESFCHIKHNAWIIDGSVPSTWHIADKDDWQGRFFHYWVNPVSNKRVTAACDVEEKESKKVALWPKVLEPWILARYRRNQQIPAVDDACENLFPVASSGTIRITGIENNNIYYVPGMKGEKPRINLSAVGGMGQYHWYINGEHRYSRSSSVTIPHRLDAVGVNQIVVVDDAGNTDKVDLNFSI